MHRKALGKGLDALFSSPVVSEEQEERPTLRRIMSVSLNDIVPNSQQPREHFNEEAMAELKASIAQNGILEPPVVRRKGDYFELIAGERRFRAARELKLETIEVIVMDIDSEEQMIVLSLIENIQRENLNAIEEAKAYNHIMNTMGLTQEGAATVVGKSRSTVANMLRLLTLSQFVQDMVSDGSLASGSARTLVTVENEALQQSLAKKIAAQGLSTRKAEALVKQALSEKSKPADPQISPDVEQIRLDIQRIIGTRVRIHGNGKKGKIEIPYHSDEDLTRILESIKGDASV